MRCLLFGGLAFAMVGLVAGQQAEADAPATKTMEGLVTFRDGSVLRAEIPVSPWSFRDGAGKAGEGREAVSVDIGEEWSVSFARRSPAKALAELSRLARQLGAEAYGDRVAASREILRAGRGFRTLLKEWADGEEDPEVRLRLEEVVALLPVDRHSGPTVCFDRIKGRDGPIRVGEWTTLPPFFVVRGVTIPFDRSTVALFSLETNAAFNVLADFELTRLKSDRDERIPKDATWISFDKDPSGNLLKAGTPAGDLYAPLGVRFRSLKHGSHFGIDSYRVQGLSGGFSASPQNPRWQGRTVIEFYEPDRLDVRATVHRAGCWMAAVTKNGTSMEAYDIEGNLIKRIWTEEGPHEFMGIQSPVPIAKLVISPNDVVDSNYVIDDLFFDAPSPGMPMSDKKCFALQSPGTSGLLGVAEQLVCDKVTWSGRAGDPLMATGVSFTEDTIKWLFAPGGRIVFPKQPLPKDLMGQWVGPFDGQIDLAEDPTPPPGSLQVQLVEGARMCFPAGALVLRPDGLRIGDKSLSARFIRDVEWLEQTGVEEE